MNLIKTSVLNAIAVLVKMLTLLGINKVLAIYVGPSGYAALGQFQNAVQMITTFASASINTGVTKYTAEYYDDESKQHSIWRTAGTLALIGSIVSGALVAAFNKQLADWFLKDPALGGVFIWFAVGLVFFSFNTLLLAVLNGKKEIPRYVAANISGSLFALVITAVMAMQFGLYGALVALAIYQSLAFFVTVVICSKLNWFKLRHFVGRIDKDSALNLSKYAAMAFTSATCVPLSLILVRDHLGESFGWSAAGYWEAMWRLSAAYLMLITTTLSVYYLPRLSELKDKAAIRQELALGYKVIMPVTMAGGITLYLMRDVVIALLFTSEFSPMRELFALQMLGDTLKIGGWILAYLVLSKAMYKFYIAAEIIFSISFVGFTWLLSDFYGMQGVVMAYVVNYALYWLVMAVYTARFLKV
ncbi:O-antigen translocase [Pseudomonas fontis]|uniref:O-antigen translocase n=1 Tax=Pseudomonas fontis TaxID=2942633 RepID=A0ABT5NVG8_9PSED|nr:O-antigen translocase [Pseudomonas fontis]MDD0975540.1 O-antigen translocase [Pseudomonas fontis]MDD0992168.1 O-antigen translocase [Pseudomonas fontis]